MVSTLSAVQEVHGKLLVLGRGLGDLFGSCVDIWVADAGFFAEAGDAKRMPHREEEGSRCGEEDVA